MTALGASMSAPASSSAASTDTSSLLAAQCRGVSAGGPVNRALTPAPATIHTATVRAPFGKSPGQSVATCRGDRALPLYSRCDRRAWHPPVSHGTGSGHLL